jgi:prophage regulatory protein
MNKRIPKTQLSPHGGSASEVAETITKVAAVDDAHRPRGPPERMRMLAFDDLKPEKGIPFSRYWIRQLIAAGKFPKPIFLGGRKVAFLESEIDAWIRERAAERDSAAA